MLDIRLLVLLAALPFVPTLQAQDWEIIYSRPSGIACSDPARGRIVRLGKHGTTQEWDGSRWLQRVVSGRPFPFDSPINAMVYDAAHREIIAFMRGFPLAAYDGARWRTLPMPAGVLAQAIAYDTSRSRLVMLGYNLGLQTWEYDGVAWVRIVTAQNPPVGPLGTTHPTWFDPLTGHVIMFSSPTQIGSLGDLWSYDGTNWTSQAFGIPPHRLGAAIGFDPVRSRLVLFGGIVLSPFPQALTDVWEWDGTTWVLAAGSSSAGQSDSPLCFDWSTGRLLAFDFDGVTQSWDGTAWHVTPAADQPRLAAYAGFAAVPGTGSLLLVTGSETTELVRNDWRRLSTQFTGIERITPTPTTLLGVGTGTWVGSTPGVWIWNGSWTQLPAAASPPPRYNYGFAYDSARGRAVLFGGADPLGNELAETWEWDGLTWAQALPVSRPSPRQVPRLVFDTALMRTVLVGGYRTLPGQRIGQADTWAWDGTAWQQLGFAPFLGVAPNPHTFDLAFDAAAQRPIAVSVIGNAVDTYELQGANWTVRSQRQTPTAVDTAIAALATDQRGALLLFDGDMMRLSDHPSVAVLNGTGCGAPLQLLPRTWPRLGGSTFGFDLSGTPGGAVVAVSATPAGLALGGGCTAYLATLDLVMGTVTNFMGFGEIVIPIPDAPLFLGLQVFAQAAQLDPGSPIGVALSKQLALVVGD